MGGPHSKITGLGIDPTTSHLWVTKPTIAPSPLIMSLIILSIKMETNLVFSYQTTLTRIQCLWKGALVRKRVKRQRQDELVFIGMVGTPKLFSIKWLIYTFLSIEHQYDNLTVQPGVKEDIDLLSIRSEKSQFCFFFQLPPPEYPHEDQDKLKQDSR